MAISVRNLTKNYGTQKAIDDISFEVKTGEVVGFLGPNGAGKSTTMRIITCYQAATQGDVILDGVSVREDPDNIKKKIGYLPENNPLYYEMAVIDYLKFCAEIQGVSKSNLEERIKEMVRKCGLEDEKHKKIQELSKGYKQRVGLAQAMIHNPEILILDEPTSGLDPNQIVEIRNLIKELGKEKTVILSSHILSEVEATCDRILIISKGRIVADGSSVDLRKQAQGNELLTIQLDVNGNPGQAPKETLESLPTVLSVTPIAGREHYYEVQSKPELSSKKEVFDLCVENSWYLLELNAIETKLEDVFRELTN
ncbi:MAG: multidrug ABC transporter ATP-binding protein [Cyclobacteriaceae bacterium]|nr:MAG: multidrug ABC transporter ATP-binding protein [Cyclobacteriaceae bacterium]